MPLECNTAKIGGLTLCCFILFIIATILFGVSFDVVGITEVGILFDQTTKTIDESVTFPAGRYFVGVGKSFLKFPINYKVVDFSSEDFGDGGPALSVFSSEGQTISIEVSFFYRLDETRVVDLYKKAAQNYLPLIIRKSEEVLKNVASRFSTVSFFTKRTEIGDEMRAALNVALYDTYFVRVPSLQLRSVDLPNELENSLVDKVVASQNQKTEILKREIVIINAEIEVYQAGAQANVSVTLQNATSTAFLVTETAAAEAKKLIIDAQNNVYLSLRDTVFSGNNTALFNFLFAQRISTAPAGTRITVGYDGSVLLQTPS